MTSCSSLSVVEYVAPLCRSRCHVWGEQHGLIHYHAMLLSTSAMPRSAKLRIGTFEVCSKHAKA